MLRRDAVDHAGLLFFLEPVRVARNRYDVCVMKQPIEECRGERCVVGEGLVLLAKWQITGQDETACFVAFGDHLEEQVRLLSIHGQVSAPRSL
jgi:hypothetical protein